MNLDFYYLHFFDNDLREQVSYKFKLYALIS